MRPVSSRHATQETGIPSTLDQSTVPVESPGIAGEGDLSGLSRLKLDQRGNRKRFRDFFVFTRNEEINRIFRTAFRSGLRQGGDPELFLHVDAGLRKEQRIKCLRQRRENLDGSADGNHLFVCLEPQRQIEATAFPFPIEVELRDEVRAAEPVAGCRIEVAERNPPFPTAARRHLAELPPDDSGGVTGAAAECQLYIAEFFHNVVCEGQRERITGFHDRGGNSGEL